MNQTDHTLFTNYMRNLRKSHNLRWIDIADAIQFPRPYLYKLISGEKITRQRDQILRIAFAMHLSIDETQEALILYGMAPLYVRRRRDALLFKLLTDQIWDISEIDVYLQKHNEPPLQIYRKDSRVKEKSYHDFN